MMSQSSPLNRAPVDPTSAQRQARMRQRMGAPVKAHLDPQLRDRMERCAGRLRITLADLLRKAIDRYLETNEAQPQRREDRS
jgi:hypothetical protein